MKTAMILAAGRGERLKQLTRFQAKALCSIAGRSLIERHLDRLAIAGFKKVVINHAYLGGQIRKLLGDGKAFGLEIHYSPEPPGGLETGGGIVQALPLLGDKPFLCVNADIFTDFEFSSLPLDEIDSLHLVLVPKNSELQHPGDFGLNNKILSNSNRDYTFSGIACYHPQIFAGCKVGRYSMTPLLRQFVEANKANASLYQGIWFDIGSMDRLQAVHEFISSNPKLSGQSLGAQQKG